MGTRIQSAFLTGKLLIAMPAIGDPRFERTVICICSHSAEGAMGLIVNRPASGIGFADLLEQLEITPEGPQRKMPVLIGGPVERSRGFVLHSAEYDAGETTLSMTPDLSMTATIDVLRDLATGSGPERALLALGYSGWGPGQLEDEIRANGWLVADADPALVFGTEDEGKWQAALTGIGVSASMLSRDGGMA